jgi:hypothetical protein
MVIKLIDPIKVYLISPVYKQNFDDFNVSRDLLFFIYIYIYIYTKGYGID